MNTTLQIRISAKDKADAQKILKKMGMDLSTGIKTFIRQVVIDKGLPFRPRTENGFAPEFEARMIKETEWAEKHGKRYNSAEEAMASLRKL
jgi:addiction module RelB/DinJ family antitoxin